MRVGIDARAYDWTGIGRYLQNLLLRLPSLHENLELTVFIPRRFCREAAERPRTTVVPVSGSYYSLSEQTVFLRTLLAHHVDLMHFPNFNAPIFYRRPVVVTVHDLTRFDFPGQKHRGRFHQWAYGRVFSSAVRNATRIIAVSEFTKQALEKRFRAAQGKTSVVYEGVEEDFFFVPASQSADDLEALRTQSIIRPYLLHVGLWMRHKNLPTLLEAFRLLKESGYPGILVITGMGRSWDEHPFDLARAAGVAESVRFPGRVRDPLLRVLYRNADAVLFPSRSEGFGLPPLEAMASGTPVVAASSGSLPEVLGDAALFADPMIPSDFAAAVCRLRDDPGLRARMVAKGLSRARRFSWERCALETYAVYAAAQRMRPLMT